MKLEDLGWSPAWAEAFRPFANSGRAGRVSAVHNRVYQILDAEGERTAVLSGAMRHHARGSAALPTVGDWVVCEASDAAPAVITAVLPRATCLQRKAVGRTSDAQPLAANIDTIVMVMGLDGDFNVRRLERALVQVAQSGARAMVLLNKSDLGNEVADRLSEVSAVAGDTEVHVVSALHGEGVDALMPSLVRGRTLVLLGSSGAGKSTLVNRLLGAAEQTTGDVRAGDDRGRHTTTARQLFTLPGGALLIDTPGIREIQLLVEEDAVDRAFEDVAALAEGCRFRDCRHDEEPGCAVREAVAAGRLDAARLANLHKLRAEIRHQAERADSGSAGERKARWKILQKAQKKSRPDD